MHHAMTMMKCLEEEDFDEDLRKQFLQAFSVLKIDVIAILKEMKKTAWEMGTSPYSIIFVYVKWEHENPFQVALDHVYEKNKEKFEKHYEYFRDRRKK
jgi:hypothetical protein